jgi:hypothetical protein
VGAPAVTGITSKRHCYRSALNACTVRESSIFLVFTFDK